MIGTGCGSNPYVEMSNAVRNDPVSDEGPKPNAQQIQAAKSGKLECPFDRECEPAVALISVATGKGVSRCTGFLISPNRILTNDHCLKGNSDLAKNCGNYVFAHFNGDVHRTCGKVLYRSDSSKTENPDYAILELSQPVSDREPLKFSRRGFMNNEKAKIYRVQMTQDLKTGSYGGIQTRIECFASYRTLLNANVISSRVPVMTFGDCAIMNGNSGSPILNAYGEVAAINQGFLTVKNDIFADQLKDLLLDGSYGQVALGSQTRCMPELVGLDAKACENHKPILAYYPKDYLKEFGTFSSTALPMIYSKLNWVEYQAPLVHHKSFATLPKCIALKDFQSSRFSFTSSLMSYRQGFNSRLQGEWRSLFTMGEKQTVFSMTSSSIETRDKNKKPAMVTFESADVGKISIAVCP